MTRASDSQILIRSCNDCLATVAGSNELGWTVWLDVMPITLEMEEIFHKYGRNTYHVQPLARRRAWVDWRSPSATVKTLPSRGFILVEHAHKRVSKTSTPEPPPWLVTDYTVTATPPGDDEFLF